MLSPGTARTGADVKFEDMTPGIYVEHRNGSRGHVDDNDGRSFAIIWDHAGRVVYPARQAKDFEPR